MIDKLRRVLAALLFLLFLASLLTVWWLLSHTPLAPGYILVEPGDRFSQVVGKLHEKGFVHSPWLFSKVGVILGIDRRIIAGRYNFDGRMSNLDIMRKLRRGDIVISKVIIPEGFTVRQIKRRLEQDCGIDPRLFDSLAHDSAFLSGLGIPSDFAEGYLFPETYILPWGISAADAIKMMSSQLFSRLNDSLLQRARQLGMTLEDVLTMASIIELEAFADDELSIIASVYYNRQRIGMPLQADPTVIYGMGGLDRGLKISDYHFPSTYNTYLHKGLPPTPICSPGMKAIMAALYPAETNYLYFVADGKGRHIFNRTYQAHLRDNYRIKKLLHQDGG